MLLTEVFPINAIRSKGRPFLREAVRYCATKRWLKSHHVAANLHGIERRECSHLSVALSPLLQYRYQLFPLGWSFEEFSQLNRQRICQALYDVYARVL